MFVSVDLSDPERGPLLLEPENFKAFKLVCADRVEPEALAAALGALVELDDDGAHAWLSIAGLRDLAGPLAADDEWMTSFDGMVGYAASKGWLSPDGSAIRAHVERG